MTSHILVFNVYHPGKFKKKDPGNPSYFLLVLNQNLNTLQMSLCLGKWSDDFFILV